MGSDCEVLFGIAFGPRKRISTIPAMKNGATWDMENPRKCKTRPYSAIERLRV